MLSDQVTSCQAWQAQGKHQLVMPMQQAQDLQLSGTAVSKHAAQGMCHSAVHHTLQALQDLLILSRQPSSLVGLQALATQETMTVPSRCTLCDMPPVS